MHSILPRYTTSKFRKWSNQEFTSSGLIGRRYQLCHFKAKVDRIVPYMERRSIEKAIKLKGWTGAQSINTIQYTYQDSTIGTH